MREKKDINLSINPTYECNFRCNFCYLTKDQLSDPLKIDLERLNQMLLEVSKHRAVSHIDLYGGEVTTLPAQYLEDLLDILKKISAQPINIITNLSKVHPSMLDPQVSLAVSWDYNCRQSYKPVLRNMMSIPKDLHVLMLASPQMLAWDDQTLNEAVDILNSLSNVSTMEIKPYSSNQSNAFKDTNKLYELFIQKWLVRLDQFEFKFINHQLIQESLQKKSRSWSDDHLYITPSGKWAVLDFDQNDNEFFLELDEFNDYQKWCDTEKQKVMTNAVCSKCQYLGHCLSEHLRHVEISDESCSGFKNLLNWSKKNLQF